MITLIASMLGQSDPEYKTQIEYLLETAPKLVQKTEQALFDALFTDYKITGTYSTPTSFVREHPETAASLKFAKTIPLEEFRHYISALIEKRTRQEISEKLMIIANKVLDHGLSYDDLEEIREMPIKEDLDAREEQKPFSFKESYLLRKQTSLGIQTGVSEIDEMIGGISKGMVSVIAGFTGQFKCVSGDTRLITNKGLKKIRDIYSSKETLKVLSEEGLRDVIAKHYNGFKPSVKVYVAGRETVVSPVHKFYTFRKGKYLWVEAKDLKKGDKVEVRVAPVRFEGTAEHLKDAYLHGLLVGDGGITEAPEGPILYLEAAEDKKDILLLKEEFMFHTFTMNETRIPPRKEGYKSLVLLRSGKFPLEKFGYLRGRKADTKVVPDWLFAASREVVCQFIAGLWDSDGSQTNGQPSINLNSYECLNQVAQLLLPLGILSKISKYREYYRLTVMSGLSTRRFVEIIPMRDQEKKEKLNAFRGSGVFLEGVSDEAIRYLESLGPAERSKWNKMSTMRRRGSRVGVTTFRRVVESLPELLGSTLLKKIYDNELCLQEVTHLEWTESDLYDLTVEGSPTYVVNGCVTHNTSWALNMFHRNTVKNGYGQCYISLEMPKQDIYYNILSLHSNDPKFSKFPYIYHDRIRKGILTAEEEQFLFDEVDPDLQQYMDKMVILDETDFEKFTFGEIRARLEKVDDEMPGGLDVVYWDHANLFKFSEGPQRNLSTGEVINAYVSFIRRLGIRFRRSKEDPTQWRQLTNVVLAQTNRTGWQRAVKNQGRYALNALSEANELERAASYIFFSYTTEDMKLSSEASVQMAKSRYGQTIMEPLNIFANPERYLFGDDGSSVVNEMSDSMFDQMMNIEPTDLGFSSSELDLSEFEVP